MNTAHKSFLQCMLTFKVPPKKKKKKKDFSITKTGMFDLSAKNER